MPMMTHRLPREKRSPYLEKVSDNFAIIPYSTMRSIAGNQSRQSMAIQLTLSDLNQMEGVQDRVTSLLRLANEVKGS